MAGEHAIRCVPPETRLAAGEVALAAALRENAALRLALESAVHEAWRGGFRRALTLVRGLKKGCEATHLHRDPETARNAEERLKSHSRKLVRQLFGRSSERQPVGVEGVAGERRLMAVHRTLTCLFTRRSPFRTGACARTAASSGSRTVGRRPISLRSRSSPVFGGFGGSACARPVHASRNKKPSARPRRDCLRTPDTEFGRTFWRRGMACIGPASRAPSQHGLAPGTLADALRRFLPLPLDAEISRHLAPVVHGDETGWWIRELGEEDGGNARARAWIVRSEDAVRIVILPSCSAEAALFGDPGYQVAHLICDRYSAYRKLARIMEGRIVLAYCRVHARRDTSGTATRTSHRGFVTLRHGSMPGVWRARTTQSSSGGSQGLSRRSSRRRRHLRGQAAACASRLPVPRRIDGVHG